jgi:hypothetical protein
MKEGQKVEACIICGRKVQPTENWMRCHLWGGFATFHWRCFGEYLRADSEQQVESVVWKATTNQSVESPHRGTPTFGPDNDPTHATRSS